MQTELGVLPEDWKVHRLRDFATVATGSTPPTSDAANYGDEFMFVSPMDMGDHKLITHTEKRLSKKGFSISRRFPTDSILFVCIGSTIGKCGMASTELTSNQQINAIFPSETFSADFLYYGLSAAAPRIRALAGEQAVPLVNKSQFSETRIALPALPEQRAIAVALSEVDALLAGLDRLIAKKRDLKQAAMQQLLTGKTRLAGFHGEWEVKRLGEIAHIKTGSRNNEDKIQDGKYPFYVRSEVVERINSYSHDCEAILVPGEGRIGNIFHYVNGRFDVHQRVYAITQFTPDVSARFVHFYMAMNFGAWAMQNTVKATVDSLRLPTFQAFELRLPRTKAEQTAIAAILSDMDAELVALEARRDKTRALKQGMMQELLTGRTRLV
ncbi:MAG: restriction endonuclease subunit S [Steroidobacteraceae bacterium]